MKTNNRGFTLIEVIASLVLLGIIAAVAGMGLIEGVRSYMFTRMTVEAVQQAQFAMNRLKLEFMNMGTITGTGPDSITFTSDSTRRNVASYGTTYQITRTGNQINLTVTPPGGGASTNPLITNLGAYPTGTHFLSYTANDDSNWLTGPSNFRELKSITMALILNRPDGNGTLTFVTAVNPRNNGLANAPQPTPGG